MREAKASLPRRGALQGSAYEPKHVRYKKSLKTSQSRSRQLALFRLRLLISPLFLADSQALTRYSASVNSQLCLLRLVMISLKAVTLAQACRPRLSLLLHTIVSSTRVANPCNVVGHLHLFGGVRYHRSITGAWTTTRQRDWTCNCSELCIPVKLKGFGFIDRRIKQASL